MSTALAVHDPRAALIEERRAQNRMMQQIRGTTWSKDLDHNTTLAVAEYCRRNDIDAATEIEVLGGRLYKNASWYERKGAELMAAGIVASIESDHVGNDPRLTERYEEALRFAADSEKAGDAPEAEHWRQEARAARREQARRRTVRIDFNAPEKAAAVVVTTIRLVTGVTVTGCNWCGNGVRPRDPVGDADPSKTAETRSARRAWKKLAGAAQAGHLRHPVLDRLAAQARTDDDDSLALNDAIQASHAQLAAQTTEHRRALNAGKVMPMDPYHPDETPDVVQGMARPDLAADAIARRREVPPRVVTTPPVNVARAEQVLAEPDPYGDDHGEPADAEELFPEAAVTTRRRRDAISEGR